MDEALTEEFALLAVRLHDEPDVEQTTEQIVDFALGAIGCDHAGVVLVHRGTELETLAATAERVSDADQLQLDHGDGPSLTAGDDEYLVQDTSTDPRWPTWGPLAARLGLRSVVGASLAMPGRTVGWLNLYAESPGRFDADDVQVARVLALHASAALGAAHEEATLRRAVDGRNLIGQAQGILMERHGLDAESAFALLRRYSQDHNVKLRDVAAALISTGQLPG